MYELGHRKFLSPGRCKTANDTLPVDQRNFAGGVLMFI